MSRYLVPDNYREMTAMDFDPFPPASVVVRTFDGRLVRAVPGGIWINHLRQCLVLRVKIDGEWESATKRFQHDDEFRLEPQSHFEIDHPARTNPEVY